MQFEQVAARLTEKLYAIRGSNQANEIQALIVKELESAYTLGRTQAKVEAQT